MSNSPAGAEFDPRNPELERDYKTCPLCEGTGLIYNGESEEVDFMSPSIFEDDDYVVCEACEGLGFL